MINGFKFYKPCKLLQDYVRYYWTFESDKMIETYTFPIGCPQIIFHKKSTLYIPELDKRQDTLTISGQVNFSSHISADDSIEMIVAVLHPYAMNIFLDIPTLHFYNKESGAKIKTNYYDYFNDKKIKSVDEYDEKTGQKIRTTNYTLYKSVTEYNRKSGKKLKTVNYSLRDENKITSIHEYHSIYDRVTRISIFRPDGKSISMVKEINPLTERVEQCINYKKDSYTDFAIFKQDRMLFYITNMKTVFSFVAVPAFAYICKITQLHIVKWERRLFLQHFFYLQSYR